MKLTSIYSNLSIKYKFLLPVTLVLLISYCLILGNALYTFQTHTKKNLQNQIQATIYDKINAFNKYLYQLNQATDNLLYRSSVYNYLLSPDSSFLDFNEEVKQNITLFDVHPFNIYLEDQNGTFYINDTIYSSTENQYQKKLSVILSEARKLHGKMYFCYFPESPFTFTMARTIYKIDIHDINQEIGIFMCDININSFYDIFGQRNSSDVVSYILTDAENQIIASNSFWTSQDFESLVQAAHFPTTSEGTHIYKYQTSYPQLKIYVLVEEALLFHDVYRSFFIQLFIILLSLLLIATVIFLVARNIESQFSSFIQKIAHTNQIDSKAYITITSHDEFFQLAQVYNNMLTRIHNLIETVYEQKLLNQHAQLKSLQSQINPHFLYNSLDSISSLIELNRPKDAQRAICALACIMRMSIKGKDILTIGEDLDYINQYLFIQKLRFQDKILFWVDVPESLYQYSIPKLCIQPLVENSLIHGVGDRLENAVIGIFGYENQDCIYITVLDNGTPIPNDVIQRLNETSAQMEYDMSKSMGLLNIQKRIQMIYGTDFGLSIKSSCESGNQVTIMIPKKGVHDEAIDRR